MPKGYSSKYKFQNALEARGCLYGTEINSNNAGGPQV